MSSADEEPSRMPFVKKRRVAQRACDICRRRKIKCDEPKPPHNKCSNCFQQGVECTYIAAPKKRGRPKSDVEGLQSRISFLEGLVNKLCPDKSTLHSLVAPHDEEYAAYLTGISASSSLSTLNPPTIPPTSTTPSSEKETTSSVLDIIHKVAALSLGSQDDPFRDDDFDHAILTERIKSLCIKPGSESNRFWGKSSGAMLMQTAILLKNEYSKDAPAASKRRLLQNRRQIYWKRFPWEKDFIRPAVNYTFPPSGLIPKLIDAYFEHVNLFYPLLHRPTFDRNVKDGLHLRDEGFGGVLLLVCAVGSRYMEQIDEQALTESDSRLSVGWKWYNQVQVVKQCLLDPPTLYDLQSYSLAVHFLSGCYSPQAVWILTGFGIRLAQDVGAHRRRVPMEILTVEDELWKRAFWVLVVLDRMISMGIGRPCAIFDDHFDVDMPIECDDEYWEDPDPMQRFKQPESIPSTVATFNQLLRLYKIMAFAMNTIYSIKTKLWDFILQEWEQHIVAALDSALNNWISSLPEYLRWDPNRMDDRFFKLSGSLITCFYYVQILIHRPYIGVKGEPSPLSLSSLAICTSAARSCSLVLEQQMKRNTVVYPYMQISAVIAGVVLLLNIWGGKKSGVTAEPKAMRQVEICMDVLKRAEDRWRSAGTLTDMLNELTTAGQLLLPEDEVGLFGIMSPSSSNAERPSQINSNCNGDNSLSSHTVSAILDNQLHSFAQNMAENSESETRYPEHEQHTTVGHGFHDDTSSVYNPFSETFNTNLSMHAPFNEQQAAVNNNTMAMWFNAPNGFDLLDEWNSFFASFQD